jgi:uncharacterized surface protein with fasciclin (FAS1) repeats
MLLRTLLATAALGSVSCASSTEPAEAELGTANDIVDVVSGDERFDTFSRILHETGLDQDLSGPGPFTVFAPTDAAFDLLDEGVLEDGLKRKNRRKLEAVVRFHSARGRFDRETLQEITSLETISGQPVPIKIKDERILVGSAVVVGSDIDADNGVIHAVDHVMRPPRAFLEAEVQRQRSTIRGGPDAWWW